MSWTTTSGVVIGLVFVVVSGANGQGRFPPTALTNLQVLPATSTPGEVIAAMKTFAQSLGVRCQFCHIGQEGAPLDRFDFVSDDNARKQTARAMMRMTGRINGDLAAALPGAPGARVTCYTCHRGAQHPPQTPDAVK